MPPRGAIHGRTCRRQVGARKCRYLPQMRRRQLREDLERQIADAQTVMERVLEQLEGTAVGPLGSLQASVGVAPFDRAQSGSQLLAAAAQGLERARSEGGGRVSVPADDGEAPADTHRRDAVAA